MTLSRFVFYGAAACILLVLACNGGRDKKSEAGTDELVADSLSIIELNKAIREDPYNDALFRSRGKKYRAAGKLDSAINDLSIALKLDSLNRDNYYLLCDYYMEKGKSGKARGLMESCLKHFEGDGESLLRLAQIHYYVRDYTETMRYLNEIKAYRKADEESYFIEGMVYLENEDTAEAIKRFQKVLEYDPSYVAAYNMIGTLMAAQNNALATEYLSSGLIHAPQSVELHYHLGYYYQEHGATDSAMMHYRKIIQNLDSTNFNAHYNMGYIYLLHKRDYPEAVKWFTKTIRIDSSSHRAFYNRGYARELMGNYAAAEADYRQALTLYPNYDLAVRGLNSLDGVRQE